VAAHLILIGLSSSLGGRLIRHLWSNGVEFTVSGTYRTASEHTRALIDACVARGSSREGFVHWDMHTDAEPLDLRRCVPTDADQVNVVYMSGAWDSTPIRFLSYADIDRVVSVGLIAPLHCAAELARLACDRPMQGRFVFVTGLGGERASGAYLGLYGAVTGGAYNVVRSLGEELAGSRVSCMGLALGLFDKGQAYIDALCEQLPIRRPSDLSQIVQFLAYLAMQSPSVFNGGVYELAGGLLDYQGVAKYLNRNCEVRDDA